LIARLKKRLFLVWRAIRKQKRLRNIMIKKECPMIKKVLVWLTGLCLLVSAASVSANQEVVDRIVAVINDDIITLSRLHKAVQPYLTQVTSSSKSETEKKQKIEAIEKQMLNTLIDRTLTRQEAVRQQISVSDDEVTSAIDNFKQQKGLDQEALEKGLESEGISLEEYRERVREDIMQSMLVNRVIRARIIVTRADIEAYYQAHPEMFKQERKYHLRNILAATKADAQKVLSRLDQGLSFPEAARQFSVAPNADDGGDLGEFELQTFNDTIKTAVQPLKKGEYSGVITTGQGHQIIYVEDIIETGGQTLDQVKDEIQDILYQEQAEEKFARWIESLKKNAHIKIML
jgi:peptidyl-prolyl cis-trans isomerase SurA